MWKDFQFEKQRSCWRRRGSCLQPVLYCGLCNTGCSFFFKYYSSYWCWPVRKMWVLNYHGLQTGSCTKFMKLILDKQHTATVSRLLYLSSTHQRIFPHIRQSFHNIWGRYQDHSVLEAGTQKLSFFVYFGFFQLWNTRFTQMRFVSL